MLDPCKSSTQQTAQHHASHYSYNVVRSNRQTQPPQLYRGLDAAKDFLNAIQVEERQIKGVLANRYPMCMTPEDHRSHTNATDCDVCIKGLDGDSVLDHCYITGKYRGAAHRASSLKLCPKTTSIPVVFHVLWGYNNHLIMQAISEAEAKITCIPINTEKYISFSLGQLRFIDSAHFIV